MSILVQGVALDSQTAACNGARDWLADGLLANEQHGKKTCCC